MSKAEKLAAKLLTGQPRTGGEAKPYQVRQVRELLVKYKIEIA
jgi:hypothetical protein